MKKPRSAKKKNAIGAVIAVIVVVALTAGISYFYQQNKSGSSEQWISSGPFSINNSTYRLGDNVFMIITGLKPTDIGHIVVLDPKGGTFTKIPFNGTEKASFNYYFKPNTERLEKLCTPQDLVGNWTMVFEGTHYDALTFKVVNEWVQGSQAEIKPINPC
ncbi:MAG TPA: hypothetical protein VJ792_07245 [Candidatus Nitrosotalea sp.]|nr:hypothetical protein [Candidatus Nitrosotalea sp.]